MINFETSYVLQVLRALYLDARKEIKKREKENTPIAKGDTLCDVSYYAEEFNMNLVIKEGGMV